MNYARQLEDMRKQLLRMLHVFLFENAKPIAIEENKEEGKNKLKESSEEISKGQYKTQSMHTEQMVKVLAGEGNSPPS